MANFSQAFGYRVYIIPIKSAYVDFADLALGGLGDGKFIDHTTTISNSTQIGEIGSDTTYHLLSSYSEHAITNVEVATNVATIDAAGHTFIVGDKVEISGLSQTVLNGVHTVTAITAGVDFSFAITTANISSTASAGTVKGGTDIPLDGSADPIRLLGLNTCSLATDTNIEQVQTYDDETEGFDQGVATGKSFNFDVGGSADFNDAGYKIMRLIEKNAVSENLMAKLARIGPTGTTETTYGYGRFSGYNEGNDAGAIVSWTSQFQGYGAYKVDFA
jgi:hypothetical protein